MNRNGKTMSRYNHRFAKTYNPNYEPWVTMEELLAFIATQRQKESSQNGSAKGV